MYINKFRYVFTRITCFLGMSFFGTLTITMVTGLGIDLVHKEKTPGVIWFCVWFFLILWVLFLVLHYIVNKVKIYNSFFATDADGVVYPKMIAKSLGITEKRVIGELRVLLYFHYFNCCELQYVLEPSKVVLSNPKVTAENRKRYKKVLCKNCGGENQIREGFVYGCKYCSGRIE